MSTKIGIRAWIDFAFRKIFGKPGNEICLISLLNAVLKFPYPVVAVEYLNPFGIKSKSSFNRVLPSVLSFRLAKPTRISFELAYWIENSSEHSVEELQELLPGLEFLRATGELNAIREITEEKLMYDAREKANLDIQSNLIDARLEGIKIGEQIGEQRGELRGEQLGKLKASIQIYEGLLGDAVTSDSDLSNLSIEALESMVVQLQKRLRDRTT